MQKKHLRTILIINSTIGITGLFLIYWITKIDSPGVISWFSEYMLIAIILALTLGGPVYVRKFVNLKD